MNHYFKYSFPQTSHNQYPYGKVLREFNEATDARYLTTHHERDKETGFDYRGARFYDSDLGRFLSLDPLAMEYPSYSDYSYVLGNPIRFTDPTGMVAEDIIFQNNDGEEIARIIKEGDDIIEKIDTDISFFSPLEIDLTSEDMPDADAVGFDLGYSGTVGGGMHSGLQVVYFLAGEDAGSVNVYGYKGANVGLEGGIGGTAFYSVFNKDANLELFNAEGFAGGYNGVSAGALIVSSSYSWGNDQTPAKHDEIYPGQKYTWTWKTNNIGIGIGGGKVGLNYFGGVSSLLK